MSTDADFDSDDNPAQSYISIEDERRADTKAERDKKLQADAQADAKKLPDSTTASPPEALKMAIEAFMSLVSVNVNRVHVRFEDDYFSYVEGPYSFGLTLSSLNVNSTTKEIAFRAPLDLNYQEVTPDSDKNLFLKHILVRDVAVYWNSRDRMHIPSAVQRKAAAKARKSPHGTAIDQDELRMLMLEPFEDPQFVRRRSDASGMAQGSEYNYIVNPFTIDVNMSYYRLEDDQVRKHPHDRFNLTALVSSIRLTLRPSILPDLRQLMEYFQFQMMLPYLRRYKPRRRPLTIKVGSREPAVRRVRRQIIKDWLSYVVWSNRLKRVLANDV